MAICDHVRDWAAGSRGHWVSMGVHMDGSAYGVAEGIYFSVPCIMCGSLAARARAAGRATPLRPRR